MGPPRPVSSLIQALPGHPSGPYLHKLVAVPQMGRVPPPLSLCTCCFCREYPSPPALSVSWLTPADTPKPIGRASSSRRPFPKRSTGTRSISRAPTDPCWPRPPQPPSTFYTACRGSAHIALLHWELLDLLSPYFQSRASILILLN